MLRCMLSSREMCRSPEGEVPNPYRGGPDRFECVHDLVEESLEGLLEDMRNRYLMNDRG